MKIESLLDWPSVFYSLLRWKLVECDSGGGDDKDLEDNLVDMWRTFRVSEVEGTAILLVETKPKALKEKGQFSLLAKLFTDKRFIGKTMKTTLCNPWNPKRGVKCKELVTTFYSLLSTIDMIR